MGTGAAAVVVVTTIITIGARRGFTEIIPSVRAAVKPHLAFHESHTRDAEAQGTDAAAYDQDAASQDQGAAAQEQELRCQITAPWCESSAALDPAALVNVKIPGAEQTDQSGNDQVNRDDVIQQARYDEYQDACD